MCDIYIWESRFVSLRRLSQNVNVETGVFGSAGMCCVSLHMTKVDIILFPTKFFAKYFWQFV